MQTHHKRSFGNSRVTLLQQVILRFQEGFEKSTSRGWRDGLEENSVISGSGRPPLGGGHRLSLVPSWIL